MKHTYSVTLQECEEICIIDDSPVPMAITKRLCQKLLPAIPIVTFPDVDSAIVYLMNAMLKKRTIFLDLYMPEKNGWNFLEIYNPSISDNIYILSSSESEEDKSKAKTHPHVRDFISKPLTFDRIKQL
ncbi:MAG: response regulator [Bacteroidota bacterium]